jgi:hypothetical protein
MDLIMDLACGHEWAAFNLHRLVRFDVCLISASFEIIFPVARDHAGAIRCGALRSRAACVWSQVPWGAPSDPGGSNQTPNLLKASLVLVRFI